MADYSDALGLTALPGPASWASPDTPVSLGDYSTGGSATAPLGDMATLPPSTPRSSGLNVPVGPPSASGGLDLQQILGMLHPQQSQNPLSPNSQFMAALGAGLSSAGQNWNKPALAAFASGAGAALQGGQQWGNQQQDARLKALQTAIAAWKAGDVAAYHQALVNFRAAGAPPPTSPATPSRAVPANAIALARDAIARGAPRDAVIKRLRERGVDPSGL